MDEYSNSVNAENAEVVSSQESVETEQTVNADNAEVTNGEQEQTAEGSNQTTDAQPEVKQETSTQSKEENAQFAKVRREAEAKVKAEFDRQQAIKDAEFAKLATENGWVDGYGNPIKTEAEYWKAVKAQREIDTLINQGKDPEAARLQVEYDRLKSEREAERTAAQNQARQNAEYAEFYEFYEKSTGKEFSKDTI